MYLLQFSATYREGGQNLGVDWTMKDRWVSQQDQGEVCNSRLWSLIYPKG